MLQETHLRRAMLAALLVLVAAMLLPASAVRAAGVVGDGTGAGCNEAALDAALAGGGLVIFNCGRSATIAISTEKTIAADTTVDGAGQITLSATGAAPTTRLFNVQSGALLALQNLTLSGGDAGAGNGGAILNAGTTQLTNVTLASNQAQLGGAIYNSATLILNGVTARDNQAQLGGAIYNAPPVAPPPAGDIQAQLVAALSGNTGTNGGGGIYVAASRVLYLVQSSVYANSYPSTGGGIYAQAATATVANSTISGNRHLQVSDLAFQLNATEIDINQGQLVLIASTLVSAQSGWSDGTFVIRNNMANLASLLSIIVGQVPCQSTFGVSSFGGNVERLNTCGFDKPTDKVNTDPQLGPLQNNGGATPTHALPLDSPALDVTTQCTWTDQRGVARPKHSRCDSGAYEYNAITSSVAALPAHSSYLLGQGSSQGILSVALGLASIPTPATLEYLPRDTPPHAPSLGRSPITSFDLQIYAGSILHQLQEAHTSATPVQLGVPITLTLNYQNLPSGVLPASLGLAWYDPTIGHWLNLPTTVNPATKTLTVQTSHLGTFALAGGPWVVALPLVVR